jgi:hypothetical protein
MMANHLVTMMMVNRENQVHGLCPSEMVYVNWKMQKEQFDAAEHGKDMTQEPWFPMPGLLT